MHIQEATTQLKEVYTELLHHSLDAEQAYMLVDGYVQHAQGGRGQTADKADIPRMKKVYEYAFMIMSACEELTAGQNVATNGRT
jgi:hypothetical protein